MFLRGWGVKCIQCSELKNLPEFYFLAFSVFLKENKFGSYKKYDRADGN